MAIKVSVGLRGGPARGILARRILHGRRAPLVGSRHQGLQRSSPLLYCRTIGLRLLEGRKRGQKGGRLRLGEDLAWRLHRQAVCRAQGVVALSSDLWGLWAPTKLGRGGIGVGGGRGAGRRGAAVAIGSEVHMVGFGGEDEGVETARRGRSGEAAARVAGEIGAGLCGLLTRGTWLGSGAALLLPGAGGELGLGWVWGSFFLTLCRRRRRG